MFTLLTMTLTMSNHEPRSLWRLGSTRNQRINRFPATVFALLLYIYIYIYMFMEMRTSCPGTSISVDHRHRWRNYCRAHIQFVSSLYRRWMRESAGSTSLVYVNKTGCSPSLSLLSQILQGHVMHCEQWAPTGRNINLHLKHWGWNKTSSKGAKPKCAVCACRSSTFEITNLSVKASKDTMWLWTAVSSCGALFYDERSSS